MIGIYKIENKVNGKIYVGQSVNIKSRWSQHRNSLRHNCHENNHLQRSWNKYGENNFEFSVVEETSKNQLNERQTYWINFYNSKDAGYNLDNGGDGIPGYKHTRDEIIKMRRIQNPEIVLQFDENFNFIYSWCGGISHIKKVMGYTKESIEARCKHTISKMVPYKNCYWVYEREYLSENFSWQKYLNNELVIELRKRKPSDSRRICQYTPDRELVKKWECLKDIRKAGYNTAPISTILHHRKGKKTAYGAIWAYEDYDFSDGYFDTLKKHTNKGTKKKRLRKLTLQPKSY